MKEYPKQNFGTRIKEHYVLNEFYSYSIHQVCFSILGGVPSHRLIAKNNKPTAYVIFVCRMRPCMREAMFSITV